MQKETMNLCKIRNKRGNMMVALTELTENEKYVICQVLNKSYLKMSKQQAKLEFEREAYKDKKIPRSAYQKSMLKYFSNTLPIIKELMECIDKM